MRIGKMKKTCLILMFAVLLLSGIVFAQVDLEEPTVVLVRVFDGICTLLITIIPLISISLFILAGVVYGIGHLFGSEIQGKAKSWAINMIIGAIVGMIFVLLARFIPPLFLGPEAFPKKFCMPQWGELFQR